MVNITPHVVCGGAASVQRGCSWCEAEDPMHYRGQRLEAQGGDHGSRRGADVGGAQLTEREEEDGHTLATTTTTSRSPVIIQSYFTLSYYVLYASIGENK